MQYIQSSSLMPAQAPLSPQKQSVLSLAASAACPNPGLQALVGFEDSSISA